MKEQGQLTIVSCGLNEQSLTAFINELVLSAKVIAGGQRLLDFFPDFVGEKIVLDKNFISIADGLLERIKKGEDITILSSGDSLFFGVANFFKTSLPFNQILIYPNISAMQSLCSKICQPWEKASFFSLHGRNSNLPWREILNAELPVIYSDSQRTVPLIAQELLKNFPNASDRLAAVGENLGSDNEKVIIEKLRKIVNFKISGLSVLMLLPVDKFIQKPGLALGLQDSIFVHENRLITHSEVRAIIISKLRLRSGVMWDLGAGSGSIGLEVASLNKNIMVYSIEQQKEREEMIQQNIKNFGLNNIQSICDNSLAQVAKLPLASAIFIGGGGQDIAQIAESAFKMLLPGGIMVASAVLLETTSALTNCLKEVNSEVISLSINRSKKIAGARFMKSENTINLFVYEKTI